MKAIILSIGDELVLGQTVDTNSAWMSRELAAVGLASRAHMTVGDDLAPIEKAVRDCAVDCDFLLVSGGLGPTEDDLTRQALANVLGVPLDVHEHALEQLAAFFRKLNRPMAESNKLQAMIPRGANLIENTCGTAPGIDALWQSGDLKQTCRIFVMPGVPKEMKAMFTRDVLPHLATAGGGAAIVSRTLHTFGMGESNVGERLGALMKRGRNPSVGTTVAGGIVSVRVNSSFESKARALHELENTLADCRAALGDLIYGQDEQTQAEVVAELLGGTGPGTSQTVATAESCTGGLAAKMLTDAPGASAYFKQGWVTYAVESKTSLLGVSETLIRDHGVVSEPVAEAMAVHALELAGANYALSITGLAGPDGGTPNQPVGTICIGLAYAASAAAAGSSPPAVDVFTRTFRFSGDRDFIRDRSAKMALTLLRFHLLDRPTPF